MDQKHPVVIGISGASGAAISRRLLEAVLGAGHDVHATMSVAGQAVYAQELGVSVDPQHFQLQDLWPTPPRAPFPDAVAPTDLPGKLSVFSQTNLMAPIASGSFLTAGMVICPCSGGTLAAIAAGTSTNLMQRAADVHLKERRPLILVPRETPLSLVHLENMRSAHLAGATLLPAAPGWYHGVQTAQDLVDFVVARILDQLGIENRLIKRWGSE